MRVIVPHCRGTEYREFRIDREPQLGVRGPQRTIDRARIVGAGEDEAEVTRAFGQRHQKLLHFRGDAHVDDIADRSRPIDALDAAKDSASRNRNHHHTRRLWFARPLERRLPQRVAKQQFLE